MYFLPDDEKERPLQNARREIKYLIPLLRYKALEPRLKLAMHPDRFACPDGWYRVRSLYFDSVHNEDFQAVVTGLEARKKIRLRIYSLQDEAVNLEYKRKQGVNQEKTSILISRKQAQRMILGRYGFLLKHPNANARMIHRDLMLDTYRPKVVVEYERTAFTAPGNGIRITFDSNITASWIPADLFSPDANFTPLIAADCGVLEVKYDGFLYTYLQNILRELDALPNAMSKYVLSRVGRW